MSRCLLGNAGALHTEITKYNMRILQHIAAPLSYELRSFHHKEHAVHGQTNDVVIYEPEDRVDLAGMSDDEFYRIFADFTRLLVVHDEHRTVVAASRSGDCPMLLETFSRRFPTAARRSLIFWSGPKALARALAGDPEAYARATAG